MKNPSLFSSVRHALRGLGVVFRAERNFRIQLLAAVLILCASWVLSMREWEIVLLLLLSGSVLVLEVFNSVIERLSNGFSPRLQPIIRDIKDLMAGAVLLTALLSTIVGAILFWPYLVPLLAA